MRIIEYYNNIEILYSQTPEVNTRNIILSYWNINNKYLKYYNNIKV